MSLSIGAFLSLVTGICWAVSPFCFEEASRKIGSFRVAFIRALLASLVLFLIVFAQILIFGKKMSTPTLPQLASIILSGVLGLGLGDMLSYEAYVQIGAQRTTLILTLAPVATVIAAWFYLHESLNIVVLFGIIIVLIGAALSVLCKKSSGEKEPASFRGIVLAVAGSVFVGLGAVFSRQAFAGTVHFDATLATAVRVTSGMTFFFLLNLFRRGDEKVRFQMIDRVSARTILLGSIMGPIGGMLCYVGALSISPAGVVSALAATSPVFILGIEAARTRSMPTIQMIAATALTVGGVWIVVSNMK